MKIRYPLVKYLNSCDLINKYNFKSIYIAPECYNIIIEVKIKTVIKHLVEQVQSFLCCYLLFFQKPKILCALKKKIKFSKNNEKKQHGTINFFLTIQKKNVLFFLHTIFLRDWRSKMHLNNLKIINLGTKSHIKVEVLTSPSLFFFDSNIKGINFNKIRLNIIFYFKALEMGLFIKNQNLIKNYQYFWEIFNTEKKYDSNRNKH